MIDNKILCEARILMQKRLLEWRIKLEERKSFDKWIEENGCYNKWWGKNDTI